LSRCDINPLYQSFGSIDQEVVAWLTDRRLSQSATVRIIIIVSVFN